MARPSPLGHEDEPGTPGPRPYATAGLFSARYLEESVPETDAWDCDGAARDALEAILDGDGRERGPLEADDADEAFGAWLLRARLKVRERAGDDYRWTRTEEGNGIARRWVDLYRFPAGAIDESRMRAYRVVLEHYDEFERKSPKHGYPGGKTRTVREKLRLTDLPVVDAAAVAPYLALADELADAEEIALVEATNGVGLEL